ncbi:MAG TPA: TonB-dependent receptor, partial [Firmicutes bacterium]|nr:TonB-dependent receptor [Bacillota bacterium]
STASSREIESRPVVNVTQALQGLVPGLNISSSNGSLEAKPSVNIRGVTTIGEGSTGDPLILIDGMEGDLNSINPQDIESISVLKDAAASSIYGSRAPFGVILVTTKKGDPGKITVNYNNNFRWGSPVLKPDMMDSYTFATYFNDASINAGWSPHFSSEHLQRIKDYQEGKITYSIIPDPNNPQYWADGYAYGNDNVDWYDAIYKSSTYGQEHNFSASGGISEKTTFYTSFNYLDQNGLMKLSKDFYDRYTVSGKINSELTNWLRFGYNFRFSRENYQRPAAMTDALYWDLARQGWPTLPLYDPNGYLYSSPSPALGLATGGKDKTMTDNTYHQGFLIFEPIKNWITHVDLNYRITTAERHWDSQRTYNHDVNGNPYVYKSSSNVHEDYFNDNYFNINAYTEYSFSLNETHNLKLMAGFQAENLDRTVFGVQRDGIIVPELPEIDLTTGLDYNGNPITPSVNGSRDSWSTAGYFGRFNYDYENKYLAEINLRYDGTSRFREDQRWNLFPSFSLGWNMAQENFWETLLPTINLLKFRVSYGELGNQNTSNWYPTYQIMPVHSNEGSWLQNGTRPNTAYVPALVSSTMGWEKVENWNGGIDFGLLRNRLTGSFDYYIRRTKDMIGPAQELPAVLGIDVPKTNNTDLKTYGFDFELVWRDRLKNGLGYSAKLLLSDSQTEITKYPNPTNTLSKYLEGRKLGEIWGYETIGIAKTDSEMQEHLVSLPNGGQNALGSDWRAGDIMYRDLNDDGKIDDGANTLDDHGDLKVIGNNTPRYLFGIDLSADWKGFDFRAFFQGVLKRDYWQGSYYFWGVTENKWWSCGLVPHVDYFRDEVSNHLDVNLDSYYPRPIFGTGKNQQVQTRYLQNASYIRLKNLQLGYTLPSALTTKANLSKVRIFVSGENLWTGTKTSEMFDPETISGGAEGNGNAYPLSKIFSFGLSITL